jgi:hypothetical protein
MLEHLLRPFAYLTIDHRVKWRVDWLLPGLLSLFCTVAIAAASVKGGAVVFGDSGLISKVLGFVQNLPGFYIAALAAIATFNRPDIDRHMPEPTPVMDIHLHGKTSTIKLTRRRFLCSMFAFLTAESILITLLAIAAIFVSGTAKSALLAHSAFSPQFAKYAFVFLFFIMFWQMVVASFWGLYYLGEKLHQPDPTP